MRIVEIGCGSSPGPFFEGAAEHYAVDKNGPAILEATLTHPEINPMVADASDLDFDTESVNIVLARNVLGDIAIGMSDEERIEAILMLGILKSKEGADESFEGMAVIDNHSDLRKIAIMREAHRILVAGGKLIAVEQKTPNIAGGFFERARQRGDFDLLAMFDIEHNLPLNQITPANYARVHGSHPELQTWVATKR